jgi:hypothetical protein
MISELGLASLDRGFSQGYFRQVSTRDSRAAQKFCDETLTAVGINISKSKEAWRLANEALWKARANHLQAPTPTNWSALVRAANRWERAAAAWSAAITTAGNHKADRVEFVRTTAVKLPYGRKSVLN